MKKKLRQIERSLRDNFNLLKELAEDPETANIVIKDGEWTYSFSLIVNKITERWGDPILKNIKKLEDAIPRRRKTIKRS